MCVMSRSSCSMPAMACREFACSHDQVYCSFLGLGSEYSTGGGVRRSRVHPVPIALLGYSNGFLDRTSAPRIPMSPRTGGWRKVLIIPLLAVSRRMSRRMLIAYACRCPRSASPLNNSTGRVDREVCTYARRYPRPSTIQQGMRSVETCH